MMENIEAAHAIYSNYEHLFKETVKKFVQEQEVKEEIKSKEPFSHSPADWKIKIYDYSGGGLCIGNTKWIETDLRKGDYIGIVPEA